MNTLGFCCIFLDRDFGGTPVSLADAPVGHRTQFSRSPANALDRANDSEKAWIRFASPAMVECQDGFGLTSELLWPGAALEQSRNRSPGSALPRHCRGALAVI
jgi:hypothetical protein